MGSAWVDHPSWGSSKRHPATGRNIADLLLDTDADELTMTRNAQLSTFVTSMVVLDAVSRTGKATLQATHRRYALHGRRARLRRRHQARQRARRRHAGGRR